MVSQTMLKLDCLQVFLPLSRPCGKVLLDVLEGGRYLP